MAEAPAAAPAAPAPKKRDTSLDLPRAARRSAVDAAQAGSWRQADEMYKTWLGMNDCYVVALRGRASIFLSNRKYDDALPLLTKHMSALARITQSPRWHIFCM